MKEGDIPEIANRGILINPANPYPEIRRHAEKNREWDFSEEVAWINRKFDQFKERFFDGVLTPDRSPLPIGPIAIENLRNMHTLDAYNVITDEYGLNYKITLNEQHYIDGQTEDGGKIKLWRFGRYGQLETLLHEMVHHEQQVRGKDPYKPGKITHNKEFTQRCEDFGLHPKLGEGYHLKPADGVFGEFMAELGIYPSKDAVKAPDDPEMDWFKWLIDIHEGKGRKGKSTLKKWCCPECGLNVRMGISGDPKLRHHTCEEKVGSPVFLVSGDVYKAKK
jgi:hypothetical protein